MTHYLIYFSWCSFPLQSYSWSSYFPSSSQMILKFCGAFSLHPEICCLPCLFLALLALRFVSAPSSSSHLCGIRMSPLSCSVLSSSPARFVSATKDNGTFVTNPPALSAIAVTVQLEIYVWISPFPLLPAHLRTFTAQHYFIKQSGMLLRVHRYWVFAS